MASTYPTHTWTNDTGTAANPNGDGTLLNNTELQSIIADLNTMFAGGVSYNPFVFGGKLQVDGFGSSLFSAGGSGANSLQVRNTSAGTGNYGELAIGNNSSATRSVLRMHSTTFTTATQSVQDGMLIQSAGVGGMSISVTDAAGDIRLYTNGTLRTTLDQDGVLTHSGSTNGGFHFDVTNTSTGVAAYALVRLNNSAGSVLDLYGTSTLFTASGYDPQAGAVLNAVQSGGLSIAASHASGMIRLYAGGSTERVRVHASGGVSIGSTTDPGATNLDVTGYLNIRGNIINFGVPAASIIAVNSALLINDSSNASNTNGLTIQQGTTDDEILSFKSNDVGHGVTTYAETDTYGLFQKHDGNQGGLELRAFSESTTVGFTCLAVTGSDVSTTHGISADGTILFIAGTKSGTTFTNVGADNNIFVVRNANVNEMIVDADGDVHLNGTSNNNVWDDHDDVALIAGLRGTMTKRASFQRFVTQHRDTLVRTKVISEEGYLSLKGAFGLTWDALRTEAMVTRALAASLTKAQRKRFETELHKQRQLLAA